MVELSKLPRSSGSVDILTVANDRLSAIGWMFQPGHTFERIEAYLDNRLAGPVRPVVRPDVDKDLAWAKDAKASAFEFEMPIEGPTPGRVDFVGYVEKAPAARLSCLVPSEAEKESPLPPDQLAQRVSGLHGPVFRTQGLRMFTDLVDHMARLGIPATGRILDWGSGCGRVTRYLMSRLPQAKILGCDIDAQAVEWCRQNLVSPGSPAWGGPDFVRIEPVPPTPFKDADVNVIIACSVLTHLSEADQDKWLAEMRRILAPGGYFLASTNGDHAFRLAHRGLFGGTKRLSGIQDSQLDAMLDGIAPPGYYRATFQSRDHTVEACSKYFEVVDYVERGLNGHQDLVILRRAG